MTTYSKEFIKEKLGNDLKWIQRAIVVIYDKQTETEKSVKGTFQSNGVGFSSCDGKYFSYLATYILKGRNISGKHLEKAKKVMPKYWKQVLLAIEEKQA